MATESTTEIQNTKQQELSIEHSWPEDMGRSLKQWASICVALGALAAVGLEVEKKQVSN